MIQKIMTISFSGKMAHAAAAPDWGRSAFDALLLTISAVERFRKHLPAGVSTSYTILSAGNMPCNVVPDNAQGCFNLEAGSEEELAFAASRMRLIAESAVMMTGTSVKITE